MDIEDTNPTKALLAAVIRGHLAGKSVIGIDTCPTGTGKTTSGREFFNELEYFLQKKTASPDLKIVIVASQHRHLGNYWVRGTTHQYAIRFLGADEYARRLQDLVNRLVDSKPVQEAMVEEGLIPNRCPMRGDELWHRKLVSAAERKRVTFNEFRGVCKSGLKEKLQHTDAAHLLSACNHACPLAGGSFFSDVARHDAAGRKGRRSRFVGSIDRPRIAMVTTSKLRYQAATLYEHHGEIVTRLVPFTDIKDAVIHFEEAADAFAAMLGTVDEMAVETELLSTAALAHDLFNRRQSEEDWIEHFHQGTSRIYLGSPSDTIVKNRRWVPVNVFQANPKHPGDYLLSVSRDRCALVIADYARYATHKEVNRKGSQLSYSLTITGSGSQHNAFLHAVVKPAVLTNNSSDALAVADEKVRPITASLGSLVQAVYARAIKQFVKYFRWTYGKKAHLTYREYVSGELNETFQLHQSVHQAALDLAVSEIDYGAVPKALRKGAYDVFAEDYYYKHGFAFCEVHRPEREATERDPLQITLNVSNPPPELMLFNLLKQRNSLVFSSASIKMKSPFTNVDLDWLLRKHLGELAIGPGAAREVIDLDDPARRTLHQCKGREIARLFSARIWEDRLLDVKVFPVSNHGPNIDTEYLDGFNALVTEIRELNKNRVPAIGIVMTNSYEHARDILRRLERAHVELKIGELFGISSDTSRSGLSILETWVTAAQIQRGANGVPNPKRESVLFDAIEKAVSERMGTLLQSKKLLNGLVVSVYNKIGKGASFRVSMENVTLNQYGRGYFGVSADLAPGATHGDFNLMAFAEHPRNLVNKDNYRRIAVQAVSIGGREMQQRLAQQLRSGDFKRIQSMMKWSRFGAAAVADLTVQGAGRIVRSRMVLPKHRRLILSDRQARLVMLGMSNAGPDELLMTPDLRVIKEACEDYWLDATIRCADEDKGAAQWVTNVYKGRQNGQVASVDSLTAVRNIRKFLAAHKNHIISRQNFDKLTAAALQSGSDGAARNPHITALALDALRQSYIATTYGEFMRSSVSKRTNEIVLNHENGKFSVISYRSRPTKRKGSAELFILKPRELYELANPAADEYAVLRTLQELASRSPLEFRVQSAIEGSDFIGPIRDGTHEAGDFFIRYKGLNLLLDVKSTATRSIHHTTLRDEESIRAEVLSKVTRFCKGKKLTIDAFIFANSGWEFQGMWYPDDLARCTTAVFHMDACAALEPSKMLIEFERTLAEIAAHVEQMKGQQVRKSS